MGLKVVGSQNLAHAALECEATIALSRPAGLAGPLCAEIEQTALVIAQLGKEEPSSVAKVGIVGAELVTVIAHGQRGLEIPWQRIESGEVIQPVFVVQVCKANTVSP